MKTYSFNHEDLVNFLFNFLIYIISHLREVVKSGRKNPVTKEEVIALAEEFIKQTVAFAELASEGENN